MVGVKPTLIAEIGMDRKAPALLIRGCGMCRRTSRSVRSSDRSAAAVMPDCLYHFKKAKPGYNPRRKVIFDKIRFSGHFA